MKAANLTVLSFIIFALAAGLCEGKVIFMNVFFKLGLSTPPTCGVLIKCDKMLLQDVHKEKKSAVCAKRKYWKG